MGSPKGSEETETMKGTKKRGLLNALGGVEPSMVGFLRGGVQNGRCGAGWSFPTNMSYLSYLDRLYNPVK